MSFAKQIGIALTAKLEKITIANGFATDIGLRVYRGRMKLDESAIPCVVMVEGDDTREDDVATARIALAKVSQRYDIEGHVFCDPNNPNDAAHDVIADIKRALFGDDLTLGGKIKRIQYNGRTIAPRLDGTALVAGAISVNVIYVENLATP